MSDMNEPRITNIKMNPDNLYREEAFTDLTHATIRRLVPVKIDGTPDESREPIFTGMAQAECRPTVRFRFSALLKAPKHWPTLRPNYRMLSKTRFGPMIAEAEEMHRRNNPGLFCPANKINC